MADLPQLPAAHAELAKYIAQHPETPMTSIMEPYREYEATLRTVYAQDRQNPLLEDPHLNVLPLFTQDTHLITTRARDLDAESDDDKSKYIMPLPEDKRRAQGSPATVADFNEFQKNFNIFSESSLVDVDWNNVVAAGSSVVNCLLPVPKEFTTTKKKLREYYHEKFCPASDVDLFLYGLTHEQAIEKIKQIERAIRDALLNEVTVVRTKYAITIASQYPVRHIQIVLRVYKSVSEILTGFDIDAAGGAYDGSQVYVTPRALASFITQINHVDLSRRSPSYENRLSKYSHRNFEVYWPELDRARVDPTIFERSFQRTLGLARLLVLERLPTFSARETYLNKRREERGRPTKHKCSLILHGNIKDYHEDEIADWLSEEDISNYHTFTVPYGQKFNAKRIEKLCYTRDLLLNAEWNQPAERKAYLHRHPAFFGRVEDVIQDCCGCCPKPSTPEEIEIAEKEGEIYISGEISFLIDDPGRQQIGSFNPLTEQDWTDMAYVGNTARLCQSIVDGDVDDVLNWLSQEGSDPNKRDYTGRSPLHLAVMTSTPEVVKCLVDHGSRLTARLADGKTALHLAASRGHNEIIKILMEKSIENEEMEQENQDRRRKTAKGLNADKPSEAQGDDGVKSDDDSELSGEDSDGELIDAATTEGDAESVTSGSFVKISKGDDKEDEHALDGSEDDPDYFQIDVLSWDIPCSPLHLAIVEGHEDTVKLLCDYGADSILPVKFLGRETEDTAALLTLVLALTLPREEAKSMAKLLLRLGATSSQGDAIGCTAFHKYVIHGDLELIDTLLEEDKTGIKTAINHLLLTGWSWSPKAIAPIHSAVEHGDPILLLRLLNAGVEANIDLETWLKAVRVSPNQSIRLGTLEQNTQKFVESLEQPLIAAIRSDNPQVAIKLLENGADPNALPSRSASLLYNKWQRDWNTGETALDVVKRLLTRLRDYTDEASKIVKPSKQPGIDVYLQSIQPDTYKHWVVSEDMRKAEETFEKQMKEYEKKQKALADTKGAAEKKEAIEEIIKGLEELEQAILSRGGKTFSELYPDLKTKAPTDRKHDASKPPALKPYELNISIQNDREMTERRRDGYIELLEAAWKGDVDKMKSLTLQAWGPEQDQPPLMMAISDQMKNTPLSLAFLRGHYEAARAVLEIVKAQWSPENKDKVRFKMESRDEDSYDSEGDCSDASEDSEPRIVSEKVDKQFTIDDIGKVSMQVQSHRKPLGPILETVADFVMEDGKPVSNGLTSGLFIHCFKHDDLTGLKFLLDMAQHYAREKYEGDEEEESSEGFTFSQNDFLWAVEHGKTRLLAHVIKRTGAGIPLDHLVKKSGVDIKKKPRYYQGLTVYGKKRKDWATAGRSMVIKSTGLKTPPLLHAALGGSIDSVEFFLGDAPHRHYSEFSKSKAGREDARLKHLKDSPGGFDRAISKWLGADNDLVIHCAVLASPGPDANELLEYLVDAYPTALEKKNSQGDTPLMVACRMGRKDFVKILVGANANQSVRNSNGENIIHAAIAQNPKAEQLREMLELLDPDLRSHLFLQRKSLQENGTTPLHTWVSQACKIMDSQRRSAYYGNPKAYPDEKDMVEMLKLLLHYSKGEELEMLDGAGDTSLHTAIMRNHVSVVKVLVESKPTLIYRENAVGRTPAEIAHDRLLEERFAKPSAPAPAPSFKLEDLEGRKPETFIHKARLQGKTPEEKREMLGKVGLSQDYDPEDIVKIFASMGLEKGQNKDELTARVQKQVIWDLCQTAMAKNPDKRRLVSLNEANDVAKRLGEKYSASRYFSVQAREEDDDGEDPEEKESKTTSDFAVQQMNTRLSKAWKTDESVEEDGEDQDEDAEWCSNCGEVH